MVEGGRGGTIINIASILAFRVAKQVPAYVAAKAGLVKLTEALALELASRASASTRSRPATSRPT